MSSFSLTVKHLGLSNDYMSFGSFLYMSFSFFATISDDYCISIIALFNSFLASSDDEQRMTKSRA